MFDAFPAGSTSVFTMRSPGLLGTPTKTVGLVTPPQTTPLVTSHLPFFVGSANSHPSRFLPFSKGFHPLSVRNGGSPCSLPSFNGGRSAAATTKIRPKTKTMAAATPTRKCLTRATPLRPGSTKLYTTAPLRKACQPLAARQDRRPANGNALEVGLIIDPGPSVTRVTDRYVTVTRVIRRPRRRSVASRERGVAPSLFARLPSSPPAKGTVVGIAIVGRQRVLGNPRRRRRAPVVEDVQSRIRGDDDLVLATFVYVHD